MVRMIKQEHYHNEMRVGDCPVCGSAVLANLVKKSEIAVIHIDKKTKKRCDGSYQQVLNPQLARKLFASWL